MAGERFYEQEGVAVTCRSFDEYVRMFALSPDWTERQTSVLDAAGGMSSFTAELREQGIRAIAADPTYSMTVEGMERRGRNEMEEVAAKLERLAHLYNWSYYGSPEQHRRSRERSFERFLHDYRANAGHGAYVASALPRLPFQDRTFSLVLCSHFLFLYNERFSYEFHRDALLELLRVTKENGEVRVYPVVDFQSRPYAEYERLHADLSAAGAKIELIASKLPFIPASSNLMRISRI